MLPLSWSLDHPGPMARSIADCALLWVAMAGAAEPVQPVALSGARLCVSPRMAWVRVTPDVADRFDAVIAAARAAGAEIIQPPAPGGFGELADPFFDVLACEMAAWHTRYADRRDRYRPSIRELLEIADARAMTMGEHSRLQVERVEFTAAWERWLREHRIDAVLEPTMPFVAPTRGQGYERFTDADPVGEQPGEANSEHVPDPYVALTYIWDWTGSPVAAVPNGLGSRSGLPVGVSVIGAAHRDRRVLGLAMALERELEPTGLAPL